jgi:hypothetical protein
VERQEGSTASTGGDGSAVAAPGRWRMGCAGRTPRKYAGFDACVERALCGRIAVGSCASDGRGRGDGGLVAGERQLPPD